MAGQRAGHAERQEGGYRASAHGGKVAEPSGESAMAGRLRRVPVKAEVRTGDGEICGDGQFFPATKTQQRAVVANAEAEEAVCCACGAAADVANESEFAAFGA